MATPLFRLLLLHFVMFLGALLFWNCALKSNVTKNAQEETTYFFEKVVLIISKLTEICCCCSQLQVSGCQKGVIFGQSSKCPKMPLSPHLPKQNQLVTGDGIKDLILLPRTNVKKCASLPFRLLLLERC